MYQNGTFNDLSPDKFENVKTVFEKMVQKNDDVRKDTTSKNKQVLIDMTKHIADINAIIVQRTMTCFQSRRLKSRINGAPSLKVI